MVNVDNLGFIKGHKFLTIGSSRAGVKRRAVETCMKNLCMAQIASTVYSKTPEHCEPPEVNSSHCTFIEALWVILRTKTHCEEPSTPEALAVMIHLVSGNLKLEAALGACNDKKRIYTEPCCREAEFIPIAALAGGLFGINLDIHYQG